MSIIKRAVALMAIRGPRRRVALAKRDYRFFTSI